MTTLLVHTPAQAHTQQGHPESHLRMERLLPTLDQFGVLGDLTAVSPPHATTDQLRYAHLPALVEKVRQTSQRGGGLLDHGDTYATAQSYDLARLAVGGCCEAVSQIVTGQAQNGIALVRPPGHHAEFATISGFCLFNNVAIAARHAQRVHGVRRVAIVDFDVHHGNGTQDIFYEDSSVLFVSTHLYMPRLFYPGSGAAQEVGAGFGQGYTLNVPFGPNVGDVGYGRTFKELIGPKLAAFQPELLLVSAGYDAHWQDPLAWAGLSLTGYAQIVRQLVEMAERLCNGRLLIVLEGGYHLEALTFGVLNTVYALLGRDQIEDPLGPMVEAEQDVSHLLAHLRQRHFDDIAW